MSSSIEDDETRTDISKVKASVKRERWVMQHVWKCGGTELCNLARANNWSAPPYEKAPGCSSNFWKKEDYGYDLVGNEGGIPRGVVTDNVNWMTILRHPYSRSLSHYHHMKRVKGRKWKQEGFTMEKFFSTPGRLSFNTYISNQQTRWHCGTRDCLKAPTLGPQHLAKAMENLDKFDVVLITEDLYDSESCTRKQIRQILNWKVEDLAERSVRGKYTSHTDWYNTFRPQLDSAGKSNVSTLQMETSSVMAALGLHNELDLQLYGYARLLCEQLAQQATVNQTLETVARTETVFCPASIPSLYFYMGPACLASFLVLSLFIHRIKRFRKGII